MAPGEESCVKLHLPQLVAMASSSLQSQYWPIKAQGAAALATVAEKMGTCCVLCVMPLKSDSGVCDELLHYSVCYLV